MEQAVLEIEPMRLRLDDLLAAQTGVESAIENELKLGIVALIEERPDLLRGAKRFARAVCGLPDVHLHRVAGELPSLHKMLQECV